MENWRYKAKAVTKYKPELYNAEGVYTFDEWTSRADIGHKIDRGTNSVLTAERYKEVEDNYIKTVELFIEELGATKVSITELYKTSDLDDFNKYKDEQLYDVYNKLVVGDYSIDKIDIIVMLALREYLQVVIQLATPNEVAEIHFGYDYYMYFVSETCDYNKLQERIAQYNMFIR